MTNTQTDGWTDIPKTICPRSIDVGAKKGVYVVVCLCLDLSIVEVMRIARDPHRLWIYLGIGMATSLWTILKRRHSFASGRRCSRDCQPREHTGNTCMWRIVSKCPPGCFPLDHLNLVDVFLSIWVPYWEHTCSLN